jgi:hypothetical protein
MLKGPGGYKSVNCFRILLLLYASNTSNRALQAGPGLFKIATFSSWMVLLSNPELVEDIRKAPEEILSHKEPLDEVPALLVG